MITQWMLDRLRLGQVLSMFAAFVVIGGLLWLFHCRIAPLARAALHRKHEENDR
jgi:hypothetical protein